MVKIDIKPQEADAAVKLINDCQVNPEMGYFLTMLKYKLIETFKAEAEKSKEVEKDTEAVQE